MARIKIKAIVQTKNSDNDTDMGKNNSDNDTDKGKDDSDNSTGKDDGNSENVTYKNKVSSDDDTDKDKCNCGYRTLLRFYYKQKGISEQKENMINKLICKTQRHVNRDEISLYDWKD